MLTISWPCKLCHAVSWEPISQHLITWSRFSNHEDDLYLFQSVQVRPHMWRSWHSTPANKNMSKSDCYCQIQATSLQYLQKSFYDFEFWTSNFDERSYRLIQRVLWKWASSYGAIRRPLWPKLPSDTLEPLKKQWHCKNCAISLYLQE